MPNLRAFATASVFVLTACGSSNTMSGVDGGGDGGRSEAGQTDGGHADAGAMDGGPLDAGAMDGGPLDAGRADAGAMEGGPLDAGAMDGAPLDGSGTDAGPCALVPPTNRCVTAGASCSGDTLVDCEPNASGCLVQTVTDCVAASSGTCVDGGGTASCLPGTDPCASISAADRCTTAGATDCADGTTLETCAPNAYGCLVKVPTDCFMWLGSCETTGTGADCNLGGYDPCPSETTCTDHDSSSCDGPTLVQCKRDGFGCYVETRTDCTSETYGYCDASGAPPICRTAASDPCAGATPCTPGVSCSGDTLHVCGPTGFGCTMDTTTDCAATGQVCDASSGTAACVDPCSLVTTCPAADRCEAGQAVHCDPDAHGCLVEASRTTCSAGDVCDSSTGTCAADTLCPDADPMFLTCATGTLSSTTVGGSTDLGPYDPSCVDGPGDGNDSAPEHIFRFRYDGTTPTAVVIRASSPSATAELRAMSTGGDSVPCDSSAMCVSRSFPYHPAGQSVSFTANPGDEYYIVEDNASPDDTGDAFDLTVSCAPVGCGDGVIEAGETCDDGNLMGGDGCSGTCQIEGNNVCIGAPSYCSPSCGNGSPNLGETCDDGNYMGGDGCSAHCAIEPGYACREGYPTGACEPAAANADCATATPVTVPSTVSVDLASGHAFLPTDGSCDLPGGISPGGGSNALWYQVTVPAGATVVVNVTGGAAPVISALTDCEATTCLDTASDFGSALLVLDNRGSSDMTQVVAVSDAPYNMSEPVTVDFSSPPCGDGIVEPGEACDDGNAMGGDGCSSYCQVEPGYHCAGTPSTCTFVCGNYVIDYGDGETCDDGNTTAGDGCSNLCQTEPGWTCLGIGPSTCVQNSTMPCADMTGATFMLFGDETYTLPTPLPFTFTLLGQATSYYAIDSNGYLQLSSSTAGYYVPQPNNQPLSLVGATPQGMVAPFWDDIAPRTGLSTDVATKVFGTAPDRTFVVAWERWTLTADDTARLTFQAWLHEDGRVELHYCNVQGTGGGSATIGFTSPDGSTYRQIAYDYSGAVSTGAGYVLTP